MLNERNIGSLEDLRESLFLERYQRLLSWAMRLTNHDRWIAEDLVQEAFIQFIRGRTSVDTIANVDGYLRRMLHYLNLARVARQTEQMQRQALSIAEYDSLSTGLHAFDIDRQLQVKEQLIDICRYACIRKETSRAGSVLILRFFHEYSPSEIGKLLCRPRHSVDEWQRVARAEMKSYLDNPRQLSFVRSKSRKAITIPDAFISRTDLRSALRQMIFNSRLGECLTVDKLKDIYVSEILENLTPDKLGHIVSCRKCLDDANQLLGLPSLSERFDVDENDHFEPPTTGNGSGRSFNNLRRRLTKHLREVVEHKPKQLRIRVNGALIGSFCVEPGGGEFQLNLNTTAEISFIDVSSERGIPLLVFETDEQGEAWGQIDLSEGRLLEVSLFEDTLKIMYHAPELHHVNAPRRLRLMPLPDRPAVFTEHTLWQRLRGALNSQLPLLAWLSPQLVTLLLATILLLATSFKPHLPSGIEPASLLQQALVAEQHHNDIPGSVTHRVITFEERQPAMGIITQRQRLEVWEDATNATRADRIFDEQNHLLAERLQNKNSGTALFHHRKTESMPISAENLFELQPTVRTFETLVGTNPILAMEQRPGFYLITYSGKSVTPIGQLLKATLTLSASDLHPVEQTLVLERGGQIREYRFTEVRFERLARQEVDSAMFQPASETNPSHSSSTVTGDRNSVPSATRSGASAELEIEVAYLLDKAKGDRNEQITLSRDKNGSLRIDGVVETIARKNELLNAFRPVIDNPSVSLNIQTADAFSTKDIAKNLGWSTIQSSNSNNNRIAVDRELREYLLKTRSGPFYGNDLDRDVNAVASQIVNRSYRAIFHAVELKHLADRYSDTNMRNISAEARDIWHEMVRTHAEGFRREYAILGRDLESIFHAQSSTVVREEESIDNDEQLTTAIQKLYRLARANNETIRAAFTISGQDPSVRLNSEKFWKDLIDGRQTAMRIERY